MNLNGENTKLVNNISNISPRSLKMWTGILTLLLVMLFSLNTVLGRLDKPIPSEMVKAETTTNGLDAFIGYSDVVFSVRNNQYLRQTWIDQGGKKAYYRYCLISSSKGVIENWCNKYYIWDLTKEKVIGSYTFRDLGEFAYKLADGTQVVSQSLTGLGGTFGYYRTCKVNQYSGALSCNDWLRVDYSNIRGKGNESYNDNGGFVYTINGVTWLQQSIQSTDGHTGYYRDCKITDYSNIFSNCSDPLSWKAVDLKVVEQFKYLNFIAYDGYVHAVNGVQKLTQTFLESTGKNIWTRTCDISSTSGVLWNNCTLWIKGLVKDISNNLAADYEPTAQITNIVKNAADYYSTIHSKLGTYDSKTNRTYVTYRGGEEISDGKTVSAVDPYIMYYDHNLGTWSVPKLVMKTPGLTPGQNDLHENDSLVIDKNGYIHVFESFHRDRNMMQATSTSPGSIDSFTVSEIPNTTDNTYGNAFITSEGVIVIVYRGGVCGTQLGYSLCNAPENATLVNEYENITYSLDNGKTWKIQKIIDPGNNQDGWNTIYFSWVSYDRAKNGIHLVWHTHRYHSDYFQNVYYSFLNMSDYNMYSADGTNYGQTVTRSEYDGNAKLRVYTHPTQMASSIYGGLSNTLYIDSRGYPAIFHTKYDPNNHLNAYAAKFYLTQWNGNFWVEKSFPELGWVTGAYDTKYVSDTNVEVYIGMVSGFDSVIHKYNFDGSTLTDKALIFYKGLSSAQSFKFIDNNRPEVEAVIYEAFTGESGGGFLMKPLNRGAVWAYSSTKPTITPQIPTNTPTSSPPVIITNAPTIKPTATPGKPVNCSGKCEICPRGYSCRYNKNQGKCMCMMN